MSAISSSQPCNHCQNQSELKPKQSSICSSPIVKTIAALALYIFGIGSIIFGLCLSFTITPIIPLATAAAMGMKWTLIAGVITTIAGVFTMALSFKIFNESKAEALPTQTNKPVVQPQKVSKTEVVEDDLEQETVELTPDIVIEEATKKYSEPKYKGQTKTYVKFVQEKLDDGILDDPAKYMVNWEKEKDTRRESVRGFFKNMFAEMGLVELIAK
jgi:hypothetical protein